MIIHPRRAILSAVACASLLAACGSGASSAGPSPSAAAPTATPDVSHPVGVIAIGHSGLTGEGTGATSEAVPENSWATGTSSDVNSVYLRLAAGLPETVGHVANAAQGGATADTLSSQATTALQVVPVPALAIISTIDNDIQCDGTDPQHTTEFGKSVQTALDTIVAASPNVKILLVGQLGRPRADFVESLVAKDPTVTTKGFATLNAIIQGYEDEEARVCKLHPQCRTDGGVRAAWIDKFEYFSSDLAHLNVSGQAAEAALIWPVVKELMGL
jgi:hypothetical protein